MKNEIDTLKKLKQNLIDLNDLTKSIQIKQVAIQIKTAEAWLSFKKGNQTEGLKLMKGSFNDGK